MHNYHNNYRSNKFAHCGNRMNLVYCGLVATGYNRVSRVPDLPDQSLRKAVTDGGAYSPFRSILLVLTHDCIIIQLYGPACGDG